MGLSEIGNKALLRRIADVLSILDVKQFPSMLDTSACGVTIEIGQFLGGIIKEIPSYEVISGTEQVADLAGMPDYEYTGVPAAGDEEEIRLLGFCFDIQGPAAGANIEIYHKAFLDIDSEDLVNVWDFNYWELIKTAANWEYRFAMGGHDSGGNGSSLAAKPMGVTWNGFIPAGASFVFKIGTLTGVNFPATSTLNIKWVGIRDAKGNLLK